MASGSKGAGMIRAILVTVIVVMVIGLVLYWFLTGGPGAALQAGKNFTNPVDVIFFGGGATDMTTRLPWQPELPRGPDISNYNDQANQELTGSGAVETQSSPTQPQTQPAPGPQTSGTPSPYYGAVTFELGNPAGVSPATQYVEIAASPSDPGPVDISGWVLQSALSGVRAVIPSATAVYALGSVNTPAPVYLAPGAVAIITTGTSPVGVSFEETECTGYLGRLQPFYPSLGDSCPAPSDALPQSQANIETYGSSCFDYLASLDNCATPGMDIPSSLSSACRTFVAGSITYNGCVARYRTDPSFAQQSWRLYLGAAAPLWSSTHDVIRLLDPQGRIVDALTY